MAASGAAKKPQKRPTKSSSSARTAKQPVVKKRAVAKKATAKKVTAKAKPRAAAKKSPSKARTVVDNVVTPVAWGPAGRTDELVRVLGGVNELARILNVSPSQPSRWKSGKERPSPEMERLLIDLDHVVARACLVWHEDLVPMWLNGANGHLNGQTPLGVLLTRGPNEVLDALSATESGAFA